MSAAERGSVRFLTENGVKFRGAVHSNQKDLRLTFLDFFTGLDQKSPQLLDPFLDILKHSNGYDSYYFECPPVTEANVGAKPFEFVLIESKSLHRNGMIDSLAFQEHFSQDKLAVSFPNLGNDALLVAPCPSNTSCNMDHFAHLASFVRGGTKHQLYEFWSLAGKTMLQELKKASHNLWFSTSGDGVAWLHLRIDTYPKYYQNSEYKRVE